MAPNPLDIQMLKAQPNFYKVSSFSHMQNMILHITFFFK